MKTSKSTTEFNKAFIASQKEMTAAITDSNNPFFKSKYADLGSVIKAVKPALANHDLGFIQSPKFKDNMVGVTTRLVHLSGEWIQDTLYLPMVKQDPQAGGSAITYARRYALQSMCGLPGADDDAEFAMDNGELQEYANEIIELIKNDDYLGCGQHWSDFDMTTIERLWVAKTKGGYFTQDEKVFIRKALADYNKANKKAA